MCIRDSDGTALPMASSHHSTAPRQVLARLAPPTVMLCCSAPPVCSSTPLRPSVHYPSIGLIVNIMYVQAFCDLNVLCIVDQKDLYRVEVRLELNGANARLIVSLLPCPSLTPRRYRQADGQLSPLYPPLGKLQLVRHRLCEALLSSSSLAGQRHPSLLSRLV